MLRGQRRPRKDGKEIHTKGQRKFMQSGKEKCLHLCSFASLREIAFHLKVYSGEGSALHLQTKN
jgi:hypothetical protein